MAKCLGTRTESLTLLSRTFVHLLLRGALLFYGISSSLLFRPTAQRPEIANCRRLGFGIERSLRKLFLTLDALRLLGSGLFFRRHRRSLGLGGFPFSLRLVDRFGACSVVGERRPRHKCERASDKRNEQLAHPVAPRGRFFARFFGSRVLSARLNAAPLSSTPSALADSINRADWAGSSGSVFRLRLFGFGFPPA